MRFPRKVLSFLRGRPLLQWVYEAACSSSFFDTVAFAVDAEETAALVSSFGAPFYMTGEHLASGTDRIASLRGQVKADIWVNWQGDEPFIREEMIRDLLQTPQDGSDVWTLKKRIYSPDEIGNPHVAKVVCDERGYTLYFSRSPIPYDRDNAKQKVYFKHVGIYAYTDAALGRIARLSPTCLEEMEQLEQLRFLGHGLKVRVHETAYDVFGIDLPEHLARAEACVRWVEGR